MTISRTQRIIALLLVLVIAGTGLGMGHIVAKEDPLQRADAIYVLGGSWIQRWLEAVDLYKEGYAPHIVISAGSREPGENELTRRGVKFPRPEAQVLDAIINQLHVPPDVVEMLNAEPDNTAQEGDAIRSLVTTRGWKRLIVITDRPNSRRAGFAMRRALGPGVEVIVRASRLDRFPVSGWWRKRADFRAVFYEFPKLVSYWLGLKG